jgi:hypothetical protein
LDKKSRNSRFGLQSWTLANLPLQIELRTLQETKRRTEIVRERNRRGQSEESPR